jgi:acyl-CoA thioesterase FadM
MIVTAKNALVETHRSVVAAWECDVMGHLTIACYFDRFADAAGSLVEALIPAAAPAAAWRTVALLTRYQQELRAGDGLAIRSGVIGRDGEGIAIGHELVNSGTGNVASVAEHRLAPRELPYGALSEHRQRLAPAVVPWHAPAFEDVAASAAGAPIDSGRDRVKAWEVDERGELSLAGYVHRFANACLHACNAFGMTPSYMRENKRGFSTFETRLRLLAPPPGAGDGLSVRSNLIAVGNASLRMLHELRQARSGELLAQMHQSGVHFDMEARRSAPLPADLLAKAQALVAQ